MENDLFIEWIGSFSVAYSVDSDGKYIWENWDDKLVPTQKEIEAKKIELEKEWQSLKYQRDRAVSYPPLAEQMDLLYHGGIDALKVELKKTKDKFPKP